MIDPREHREDYQRALAWVGEQITEAERQGLKPGQKIIYISAD